MKIAPFTKSYNGQAVLKTAEINLADGKITAVIGSNGSGKSTLARVIAAVIKPDSGTAVRDTAIKTGYLPQKSYAFRLGVEKNLLINGGDERRAREYMEALFLTPQAGKKAARLSGGETQKLALARLLMRDYELLILDEPTSGMDIESAAAAEGLISRYKARTGCTVLLITHSIPQAARLSETLIFLDGGELAECGNTQKLLTAPEGDKLKRFLEFSK